MWKRFVLFGIIGTMLSIASCTDGNGSSSYIMDFPTIDSVKWESITAVEPIPLPNDFMITDSALCLIALIDNFWVHYYDKIDGHSLGHKIRMGQGPDDINHAVTISRINDSIISLYDMNMSQLKLYNDGMTCIGSYSYNDTLPVIWGAWPLPNKQCLLKTPASNNGIMSRAYHIANLDSLNIISTYNRLTDTLKDNPRSIMMQSSTAISPDGRHFASATVIGGVLEFFSITDDSITSSVSEVIFPIKFTDINGMPLPDDPPYGFTAICADNEKVYAAYSGTKNDSDATKIGIWDWKGRPLRKIHTDAVILKLAIDSKNNTLYAVTYNDETYAQLARIKLCDRFNTITQ